MTSDTKQDRAYIDLKSLNGEPGRLLLDDPKAPDRMLRVSCTVEESSATLMQLSVMYPVSALSPGTQVALEVVTRTALVQCFTTVEKVEGVQTLYLRRPAHTHIVQRRRFPRAEVFIAATYRKGGAYGALPAQLTNLSVDGAAMVVVEAPANGSVIALDLSSIGLEPGDVPARVVRSTPSPNHLWVVGLAFGKLPPEQEHYLAEYVNQLIGETEGNS